MSIHVHDKFLILTVFINLFIRMGKIGKEYLTGIRVKLEYELVLIAYLTNSLDNFIFFWCLNFFCAIFI